VPMEHIGFVQKHTGGTPKLDRLKEQPDRAQKYPTTYWFEALPNAYEWPSLGPFPDSANGEFGNAAEWRAACGTYKKALHVDPKYRQATIEFLERQRHEPQALFMPWWAFRDQVLEVQSTEPEDVRDKEAEVLLVKHYVLRRERSFAKVQREVEALQNLTNTEGVGREPIPESVRLFVWQRDRGQCVKCGSRERLEFDHIIPIIAGGSNTERNLQLLCESCNRSKGAMI
jgi:5-methylcytosine-specific restriction endonuclease McrA